MSANGESPAVGAKVPLALDDGSVAALLSGEGWPCERLTEGVWRSWAEVAGSSVPVVIRHDRAAGVVRFAVVPFMASPREATAQQVLYERLLAANVDLRLAKFAIDDDLDVFLAVDYPVAALDRDEFLGAVELLVHHAAALRPGLLAIGAGAVTV